MNRVKIGFFSLTHRSESGDDRPYLEWHLLDHMPEQYQLPGLVLGQRWASTAACRAVRAAEVESWSEVEHLVCYLMGDPVDQTVDDFFVLGRQLAEQGRFASSLPSQYRGALRLLETQAAPRALVSAEVVPFRPHSGTYLIVEEIDTESDQDEFLRALHTSVLPEVVATSGVAGAWTFATTPTVRRPLFSPGEYRMTLCYLDDEAVAVGATLGPVVERCWADAPSRVVLAAPFESMMVWDWLRFAPGT
jgi:hypothetical protein